MRVAIIEHRAGRKILSSIPEDEAINLVETGKATKIKRGLYEMEREIPNEAPPPAEAPEDLDSVIDEEPETYKTKVMTPRRRVSRRTRALRNKS